MQLQLHVLRLCCCTASAWAAAGAAGANTGNSPAGASAPRSPSAAAEATLPTAPAAAEPVLLLRHPVRSSDPRAVCNDGSQPYYYASMPRGPPQDANSWMVILFGQGNQVGPGPATPTTC